MPPASTSLGQYMLAVEGFRQALERREACLRRRVFTDAEWAQAASCEDPVSALAARFAAKEAAFKALGTGWGRGVAWRDVEVAAEGSTLILTGRAAALAAEQGVHLTVSHAATDVMAVALVIAQPVGS